MSYTLRPAMRVIWRSIPSFVEYEASNFGQIRRIGGNPLRPAKDKKSGYLNVGLWRSGRGKKFWVHRLVCEAFHGPAPSRHHDAAHYNRIRHDNRPENLRWATRAQNEHDKKLHGVDNAGERNGMSKLTPSDVIAIRLEASHLPRSTGGAKRRKGAISVLADKYGVTASRIRAIASGKAWSHV